MSSESEWAARARECADALDQAMHAREWPAATALANDLSALLQAPPPGAQAAAVYQHALQVIQHAASAAASAREEARSAIVRLGKGRKAVSAYV